MGAFTEQSRVLGGAGPQRHGADRAQLQLGDLRPGWRSHAGVRWLRQQRDLVVVALTGDADLGAARDPGNATGPRSQHTAIYDPVRQRMVVYGGGFYWNDVWALSLTTLEWTQLFPQGRPVAGRIGHGAVYDPARDAMVIFGGPGLNDIWSLDFAAYPTVSVASDHVSTVGITAVTPNPTPRRARIDYSLARADRARISVVDVTGRRVATLVDGPVAAGRHSLVWDTRQGAVASRRRCTSWCSRRRTSGSRAGWR